MKSTYCKLSVELTPANIEAVVKIASRMFKPAKIETFLHEFSSLCRSHWDYIGVDEQGMLSVYPSAHNFALPHGQLVEVAEPSSWELPQSAPLTYDEAYAEVVKCNQAVDKALAEQAKAMQVWYAAQGK